MIQQLAIRLLGFEPKPLHRATSAEHLGIAVVVVTSLLVLICSALATYVLGVFVSGSTWIALPIAVLGTFVLFSIFRFSLILIKPRIGIVHQFNEVVLKTTLTEKWLALREGLRKIITGKLFPRGITSYAIPGFTLIFRSLYLGLIACVLIFPLSVLVHWNDSMQYNQELRQEALQTYLERNKTSDQVLNQQEAKNKEEAYRFYANQVNRSFYTMQLLEQGMQGAAFIPITIFIILCFVLPHLMLFSLMRNPRYTYIHEVKDYYQSIITQDFDRLNQEATKLIATKNKTGKPLDLSFLNQGNPYLPVENTPEPPQPVDWNTWQRKINSTLYSAKA